MKKKDRMRMMLKHIFLLIAAFRLEPIAMFSLRVKSSPLYSSYEFAKILSREGRIDNSHNHEHSKEVLYWSTKIIERLPFQLSHSELIMVGQCCILHDFMDSKYKNFANEIRSHLTSYHEKNEVDVMMNIMNTMSYSKIVFPDNTICYPEWVSYSPYENIFHIVREADLLSSYNIARMIEFRIYNHNYRAPLKPNQTIEESIKYEVRKLYHDRMDKLIEKNLYFHDSTVGLAKTLAEVSKIKLELLDNFNLGRNFDIFRIVNYLIIDDLIQRYLQLEAIYHLKKT